MLTNCPFRHHIHLGLKRAGLVAICYEYGFFLKKGGNYGQSLKLLVLAEIFFKLHMFVQHSNFRQDNAKTCMRKYTFPER